ncbi:ubiquitin-activating enzyme E1b, putative [Theileria equi strain WA]|uniref:SUMO-activating enzyme subunit n=1 Tax=Theileria equi strain WA TaxID=1537102 RepID=L0AY60_THEEQ|nr:ubiquitin-activating enzyme E1b, putative [Theileria equi strain WA]AFZ80495.1 ubiquitin-activating enzyme E1b, putative [Theileria equi strain WA]|eukprot:XP_004830161.1 ubiquitin-activating enzyme E1b, putative [Theileria equi strain WA]
MVSKTRCNLDSYLEELQSASILVIGAGGIGCEVIKNLVLNGAKNITIVDMDTIDMSNLNRQFIYLPEHVNQYKAHVARNIACEISPNGNIEALVCDVTKWAPEDLVRYDVILNALDNVKARSHINYCCIQSGIPLIESGSTGYNGQVFPILKGLTKCYECEEIPTSTSIPVCSIRQIPEKPTHCVAWARMLYELIFGTPDNNNLLSDLSVPTLPDINTIDEDIAECYVEEIFNFLFNSEIKALESMEEVWISRKKPHPIEYIPNESISLKRKVEEIAQDKHNALSEKIKLGETQKPHRTLHVSADREQISSGIKEKFKRYSVSELVSQFRNSIKNLLLYNKRIIGLATFSKDDETCVQFVAASANLRMLNFGISHLSTWDVQSIAGSIVPAIASTNAIVAAYQVAQLIHVLKFLRENKEKEILSSKCRHVWIKANVMGSNHLLSGNLSQPEHLEKPNPKCLVCQQKSVKIQLRNFKDWKLDDFVNVIFKNAIGLDMVTIDFNERNIYDCEELYENVEYAKHVKNNGITHYGIKDNSILTVTDLNRDSLQFEAVVQQMPNLKGEYSIIGKIE